MTKLLCEILSMCRRISMDSDADVFFEYSPHCNSYTVYWYRDGWSQEAEAEYLAVVTFITVTNLSNTLAKLNAIATELGVL